MGKRQWTTEAQRAWLEELIPTFVQAQQEKTTQDFFLDTYRQWHGKWPTPAPTEEEVEKAKGSADRVVAEKKKAVENVRVHNIESQRALILYLPRFPQRVKFWFHNHTRGSSSGSGTRGILKLGPSTKSVQPWQAYLNKYHGSRLKEKVNDAWQEYLSTVPEGQRPEKTLFEIRNKLAQKLYEAEAAEVKQEVEEHRQKMKNGEDIDDTDRNRKFQK